MGTPSGSEDWAGLSFTPSTMREFVTHLANATYDGYLLDKPLRECPGLLPDIAHPALARTCLFQRHRGPSGATGWPVLMLGGSGSRSALHFDAWGAPFWAAVLKGRKRFRVVPDTPATFERCDGRREKSYLLRH